MIVTVDLLPSIIRESGGRDLDCVTSGLKGFNRAGYTPSSPKNVRIPTKGQDDAEFVNCNGGEGIPVY